MQGITRPRLSRSQVRWRTEASVVVAGGESQPELTLCGVAYARVFEPIALRAANDHDYED